MVIINAIQLFQVVAVLATSSPLSKISFFFVSEYYSGCDVRGGSDCSH